jgi:hypothetical protein
MMNGMPPQGQGVDAPQLDPRELVAMQQGMQGLTTPGQGGLPPLLVKQLQNQMGVQ